jgi:hypothetical protein
LMRRLDFTVNEALAGALGLLFGTTFLHYTQNMMENNLIMLLDLTGFCFQYEWLRSNRARALLIGSAALGANLLVRLTTGMDIIACGLFLLLIVGLEGVPGSKLRQRLSSYMRIALPAYAFFFAIDRLYQWYRYGSIFHTYLGVFAQQLKERNDDLPAKFPWTTPWHEGILGPLITPEKSIFLFDPLVILTLVLAVLLWRHVRPQTKAWVLATGSLVSAYIVFYARYYLWSGDFAWGDRYVSTSVQLLAMMAIPLVLRHRTRLTTAVWRMAWGVAAASIVVQLASVIFWHPLEVYQVMTIGHPTFVVGLRFKNIVADILSKYEQWGLTNDWIWKDQWQRFHSTTPYFMPFMLWRDGSVRPGAAHALIAAWFLLLAALIGVLLLIRAKARSEDFQVAVDRGIPAGRCDVVAVTSSPGGQPRAAGAGKYTAVLKGKSFEVARGSKRVAENPHLANDAGAFHRCRNLTAHNGSSSPKIKITTGECACLGSKVRRLRVAYATWPCSRILGNLKFPHGR